jgi:hypothetical protein
MNLARIKRAKNLLTEAGVTYTFDYQLGKEHKAYAYHYRWKHIPSGRCGTETVYCFDLQDFFKLLTNWNRNPDGWVYSKNTGV